MRWNKGARPARTIRQLITATLLLTTMLAAPRSFGQSAQAPTSAANQAAAPAQPATVQQQQLLIMLDAAHGGSESGAMLNTAIPEKDVTLAIARRLRQELAARGIAAVLVRDNDATISTDQRAQIVNSAHPALYIAIHATSQGSGMCLYTAMLHAAGENSGPFVNWETAQSSVLIRSRSIQNQITIAIQKMGFPFRSLIAPLRPLNNVLVPAIAIEIAPTTGDVSQLASVDYQQMVTAALANSIAAIRTSLESQR